MKLASIAVLVIFLASIAAPAAAAASPTMRVSSLFEARLLMLEKAPALAGFMVVRAGTGGSPLRLLEELAARYPPALPLDTGSAPRIPHGLTGLEASPLIRKVSIRGEEFYVIPFFMSGKAFVEAARELGSRLVAYIAKPMPSLEVYMPNKVLLREALRAALDNYRIRQLLGVDRVVQDYGIDGSGVRIAIIDTGIDYGHPDIAPELTYYEGVYHGKWIREPLVLDADEMQVVFFTPLKPVNGYLNISSAVFKTLMFDFASPTGWVLVHLNYELLKKLGAVKTPLLRVEGIPSKSGVYRLGFTLEEVILFTEQGLRLGIQCYPVLLYDPKEPGVYSAARIDFNKNGDFTDDPILTYNGTRIAASPDYNGDGLPDVSLGVAGGFFYDWLGITTGGVATIVPGWDLGGRYLSFFYDWFGHGTACASAAAGRPIVHYMGNYTLGWGEGYAILNHTLPGMATGAKVIGIEGLILNTEVALLWAAGFDMAANGTMYYSGQPRVKIISNSWGYSIPFYEQYMIPGPTRLPGLDYLSVLEDAIATPGTFAPDYPGVLVVHAAGNGGAGYGTMTTPGAATRVLTVGASTTYHYVNNLLAARGAPLYHGYAEDDVVFWSARGPTVLGYVKPDVVDVGAYGFSDTSIANKGVTLMSGTSYATPLTAGVAALVYEVLPDASPQLVKRILMSSADNIGYDAFSMGAGRVDAYKAVSLALELAGEKERLGAQPLLAGSEQAGEAYMKLLERQWFWNMGDYLPAVVSIIKLLFARSAGFNTTVPTILKLPPTILMPQPVTAYSLFLPYVKPGSTAEENFTIYNPTNATVKLVLHVYHEELIDSYKFDLKLERLNNYLAENALIIPVSRIPNTTNLIVAVMSINHKYFDSDNDYKPDIFLELRAVGWKDFNKDGRVEHDELEEVNFVVQASNYQYLTISNPFKKLKGYDYLILELIAFSAEHNITSSIPARLTLAFYSMRAQHPWMMVEPAAAEIPAGGKASFTLKAAPPRDTPPISHEAWIVVDYTTSTGYTSEMVIPVAVTTYVEAGKAPMQLKPYTSNPLEKLYPAFYVRGTYDWMWRYEAGDWRFYYIDVSGEGNVGYLYSAVWSGDYAYTTIDLYAGLPTGEFAGIGSIYPAILNYYSAGIYLITYTTLPNGLHGSPVGFAALHGASTTYPVTGRDYSGVIVIAAHCVSYTGPEAFEPITLRLMPVREPLPLPETMTAGEEARQTIIQPYNGLYSAANVPTLSPVLLGLEALLKYGPEFTQAATATPRLAQVYTLAPGLGAVTATLKINLKLPKGLEIVLGNAILETSKPYYTIYPGDEKPTPVPAFIPIEEAVYIR
ncbi:MAG: S8 family serine peptidase [Crenarchaeota archaeon]|nr:S8 family serine peptidase [Thermoproteota archaeon]